MKTILFLVMIAACGDDAGTASPDAPTADDAGGDSQLDGGTPATSIPGGTFLRSYDGVGYDDDTAPATVSGFGLDTYEVTVARFRAFVAAGKGTAGTAPIAGAGAHAVILGSGWDAAWSQSLVASSAALTTALSCHATYQTWTDEPDANESLPINCVTWYEAMAFCIWDGGYLPTEAEWNYAAAGGSEQRAYPWSVPAASTAIECTNANYNGNCPGALGPRDVGGKAQGDGKWGQRDLSGNIAEWVLDWYAAAYQTPCSDCANLTAATTRVYRGGNFSSFDGLLRVGNRVGRDPADRNAAIGFRCARPQ